MGRLRKVAIAAAALGLAAGVAGLTTITGSLGRSPNVFRGHFDVDRAGVDFPAATIRVRAVSSPLAIVNDGETAIGGVTFGISGQDAREFQIVGHSSCVVLAPGMDCKVMIGFTPSHTFVSSAYLLIEGKDAAEVRLPLAGWVLTGTEEALLRQGPAGCWVLAGNSVSAGNAFSQQMNALELGSGLKFPKVGAPEEMGAKFDGLSGSFALTPFTLSRAESFSFAARIRTSASKPAMVVISDRGSGGGVSLTMSVGGSLPFPHSRFLSFGVDGANVYLGVVSNASVADGRWHSIIGTWSTPLGETISRESFHLYVDGREAVTQYVSYHSMVSPVSGDGDAEIGAGLGGWNSFVGAIEDACVFTKSLPVTAALTIGSLLREGP